MKKGFIGSIGDDLPSLIPLFFALMIFFVGLAFAFTTINTKNITINTYVDSLTIAKTALSDASYSNYDEFLETNKSLVTLSNYIYGLIYFDDPEFNLESFFEGNLQDAFIKLCSNKNILLKEDFMLTSSGTTQEYCEDEKTFLITSSSVKEKLDADDSYSIFVDFKHKKYFYYTYPVTLLTPLGYKVVYLLVLVW